MKYFYIVDIAGLSEVLIDLLELLPWLPKRVGVLFSYCFVRREVGKFVKLWDLLREHKFKLMLDSGAFRFVRGKFNEDLDVYLREYAGFINEYGQYFDHIATLDVPPRAPAINSKTVRLDFIFKTVKNTEFLISHTRYEKKIMPVVQGWTLDEYAICARMLKDHDLVRDWVGVGNLAWRRHNSDEIEDVYRILSTVRSVLSNSKVHGFGLSYIVLANEKVRTCLDSADSGYMMLTMREWGKYYLASIEIRVPAFRNMLRILETYGYKDTEDYRYLRYFIEKITFRDREFTRIFFLSTIAKLVLSGIIKP